MAEIFFQTQVRPVRITYPSIHCGYSKETQENQDLQQSLNRVLTRGSTACNLIILISGEFKTPQITALKENCKGGAIQFILVHN